jgi:hypothetical protein
VVVKKANVGPLGREPDPPTRVTTLPRPVEQPVGVYYPRQPVYTAPVGPRYAGFGAFRGGGFRGPIGFGGRGLRRF